jgi:hypothetical protein
MEKGFFRASKGFSLIVRLRLRDKKRVFGQDQT